MESEPLNIGGFNVTKKKDDGADLADLMDKMQIKMVGREDGQEDSGISDEDDDEEEDEVGDIDDELAYQQDDPEAAASLRHKKQTDMEERAKDDMDFPDEVDTPLKEARIRFQKYRGIKSLKNCDWDPYENLPEDYSKIWRFQNYQAAQKDSVTQTIEEGLPLNGTFITVVLQIAKDSGDSSLFSLSQPLILSTLFPHETKLSTMHFKLNRTTENKEPIPSKTKMEFHCGFRRMTLQPVLSAETNPGSATEKLKFLRFMRDDIPAIATAICPIVFAPCKVVCFTENSSKSQSVDIVAATGTVMPPNPLKVILKRIILTGYPLKCHKKKCVARYMFFEPKDIKYFKPVEIYTKHGLKVSIN